MNILITGAWKCNQNQIKEIESLGHNIIFMPEEKESLPCQYSEIDGVICNALFLYHDIKKFIRLRYIQLTSAGYDRVPMEYIKEHNITIFNARGVYSIPMAEFAVSGVLQLYKKHRFFYENQKNKSWSKHRGLLELYDKTVCIVGCGNVGTECAKRFLAFGNRVIGVDVAAFKNKEFSAIYALDKLDEVLNISDIVVLTLPLTKETKHLFNEKRFEHMKPDSVLVNISRGAVVDTEALTEALKNKLYGAVLDVFEQEPLNEKSPLWDMENVIVTPHNSFVGEYNAKRLFFVISKNLLTQNNCIEEERK